MSTQEASMVKLRFEKGEHKTKGTSTESSFYYCEGPTQGLLKYMIVP